MTKTKQYIFYILPFAATLLLFGAYTYTPPRVQAADNDFSNGITVDSTGDGADANTSDSICDDGSGNCTLRAAIEESNDEAGTQTIRFNITGTADFTNGGQNGYTIQPQSALPNITDTVVIDGYTQPGSQANTAVAPNPLNGRLLIEVDGSGAGNVNGFTVDGDNSTIRGLVINNFSASSKSGIAVGSDNLTVQGSYIGTEPDGMTEAGNDGGIMQGADNSTGAQIGGLDPEDRNLISGNDGTASSPNTGSDNWTYQGNYIGVARDGLTAIANAQPGGSGALSIDNSDGHIVGGSQIGAINVISGNNSMGIAPHNTDDLLIEGNYIGVGYNGITDVGNGSSGVNLSGGCDDAQIIDNIISNNNDMGVNINEASTNALLQDNTIAENGNVAIGVDDSSNDTMIQGNQISGSAVSGISIRNSSRTQVGGSNIGEGNIIGGFINNIIVLQTTGALDNTIQGNTISESGNAGITIIGAQGTLVGGPNPGEGNVIENSDGAGIAVASLTIAAVPLTLTTQSTTILNNSIINTSPGAINSGLGIDLVEMTDTSLPPDFFPDSFNEEGATLNDTGDTDTGPNNYINFPMINSVEQDGLDLNLNLDLDASDSPSNQYRVEIFANDTADPSGYGEGQTFLGYTNLSPGSNQDVSITLPSDTNLTGKVLSATTTAIDNTTASGFGSTSEFSLVSDVNVFALPQGNGDTNTEAQNNGALANTGQDVRVIASVGIFVITSGLATALVRRRYVYRSLR